MANFFKNPLVLAETVVGSMIDLRPVVLYEQPEDINIEEEYTDTSIGDIVEGIKKDVMSLVDRNQLKELFTGIELKYISKINGFNMYGISYMSADVNINSDLCDHPTETGSVITDNAVINPISIAVQVAMPTALYTRIYAQMIKFYQEKKYIIVQTKFASYRNMVIQAMPYKLESGTIDRPVIELQLRQVMEVEPQYTTETTGTSISNALDSEDNDTVDVGRLTAKVVGEIY